MSVWIYAVVVSVPLSLGALVLERVLRARWRAGRWAWVASLAVSSALVALALAFDEVAWFGETGRTAAAMMDAGAASLDRMTSGVPLGLLWLAASTIVLALLAAESLWLRRRSRSWTPTRLSGCRVLVSPEAGPAAFGILRPKMVVPSWVLDMPVRARRLILLHEAEHHRAGDVRVQFAAALIVATMPWNPVAWWQAARLRRAIELDCDARVLSRTHDARSYSAVLIDVGERSSGLLPVLAVGLSWTKPFLERRVEALLASDMPRRAVVPALLAVSCVTVAFAAPRPRVQLVAETEPVVVAPAGVIRATGVSTFNHRPAGEPAETVRVVGARTARIRELPRPGAAAASTDAGPDAVGRVSPATGPAGGFRYRPLPDSR